MNPDVVVIGAGPAGLALAVGLADAGLEVEVLDKAPLEALAAPAPDGREIALSPRSVEIMRALGAWARIPDAEVSALREARVVDGASRFALTFPPGLAGVDRLGVIVSNHLIRKALYDEAAARPGVAIRTGVAAAGASLGPDAAAVRLETGETLAAKLVVAADTRFSPMRRDAGISASMHDFGRTMIVARMAHEAPHEHIAWECFQYGGTLALLPLNGDRVSVVLTVRPDEAERLMALTPESFAQEAETRAHGRLGRMRPAGERFAYPLVSVDAQRFVAQRFALVGDAAVGMHPVTAHGFNFGLQGAETLSRKVGAAARAGRDIGGARALLAYEAEHKLRTRPLYEATLRLVQLYTNDAPPARLARGLALRAGELFTPGKWAVMRRLVSHQGGGAA